MILHIICTKLCNISQLFDLTQVVNDCSHPSRLDNPEHIDLAFMSSPSQLLDCCPIVNSDHNDLKIKVNWEQTKCSTTPFCMARTQGQYAYADFKKTREQIHNIEWNTIHLMMLTLKWKSTFWLIMEESIPKRVLPPHRHNLH